jgi:hypothetical protein
MMAPVLSIHTEWSDAILNRETAVSHPTPPHPTPPHPFFILQFTECSDTPFSF